MSRIEFKDFNLKFWGHDESVLSDINLSFDTRERILLLAPSGKGKSTLLMSLLGVIQRNDLGKSTGSITIDGKDIEKISSLDIAKKFGIVFQEPESQFCLLYPDEEVAFGLENFRVSQKDITTKVDIALKKVGVYKKEQLLSNMSGGEQQRVAIASSVALESEMLLLDEPTANLDAMGREDIMKLVCSLDKGFFLVEHNLDEWIDSVDRVILLGEDGKIEIDCKTKEFLETHLSLARNMGIWEPGNKWSEENMLEPMTKQTILAVKNLSFSYGDKKILRDLDFSLKKGEILAVLGKNGAGKSSLSKVLGKLVDNWTGQVLYNNKDINTIETIDFYREIAYVFQNPEHQFIRESVEKEIELSLKNYKIKQSLEEVVSMYNLTGLEKENPFTLSGGEKRRLSVATMLSDTQSILILDEPTFGLDYANAKELMDKIASLAMEGIAVIIITHDMEMVHRYAHTSMVLEDGKKVFHGTSEDLWESEDILKENKLKKPRNYIPRLKSIDKKKVV